MPVQSDREPGYRGMASDERTPALHTSEVEACYLLLVSVTDQQQQKWMKSL